MFVVLKKILFGVFMEKERNLIAGKSLVLALIMFVFTGCVTSPVTSGEDTEAFARRLIANKLAIAANAQREYVELVNEDKSVILRKQAAIETDEVDVDYIGKPQELLQIFAYRYGYRYIESGKRNELRTINVRVQNVSPIEVLRNIGYQVDTAADVVLDKNTKTLRLIYKNIIFNEG